MGDPREDTALLAAHVAGDPDAFAELVARHRDRLWAVALRTTGHPEEAADGLQDGLVAAYRRAGSFRGEAAVTTWLHRVVVNACLDRLRAARSRRTEPLPDDLEEYGTRGAVVAGAASEGSDPAAASVAAERRRLVVEALQALPAPQRAALVLVDLEGFSVAEAAAVLDCKVGTVKSRCSRGRAALAEALRPLLVDDADPHVSHDTPGGPGTGNRARGPSVRPVPPTRAPPGA